MNQDTKPDTEPLQDNIRLPDIFTPCKECGRNREKCMCGYHFNPDTDQWEKDTPMNQDTKPEWEKNIPQILKEVIQLDRDYDNDMAMTDVPTPIDMLTDFIRQIEAAAEQRVNREWVDKLNLHSFIQHYGDKLETIQKLKDEAVATAERKAYERVIAEIPDTPEQWSEWTIDRQIGYNRAILNFKQQLRDKFLTSQEDSNN